MAEEAMEKQWAHYVWPKIKDLPKRKVLDLACGHGRNTEFLKKVSKKVICADINEECIQACEERFGNQKNVDYLVLDGFSLKGIRKGSISLIYSWDSFPHFEPDVVRAYIKDFPRVLTKDGHGFIHHSNFAAGKGQDWTAQPHYRNYMTADLFAETLESNGLEVVSQQIIGWDESLGGEVKYPELDCITVFKKR